MTSPSAILLAGGGVAVSLVAGLPLAAAVGVGALAWAARVAVAFAVPRGPRRERIDPFALGEPWRGFVRDALHAQKRFERTVHSLESGPLKEHLADIGERVRTGVDESWHVAKRAQAISNGIAQLDTADARRQLAALEADTSAVSERRTQTEESLRAQISSAERMSGVVRDAQDRLRLLDARLDEAAARAVELSVEATDEGVLGLSSDVDDVVTDMEALRQALEETGTPPAAP